MHAQQKAGACLPGTRCPAGNGGILPVFAAAHGGIVGVCFQQGIQRIHGLFAHQHLVGGAGRPGVHAAMACIQGNDMRRALRTGARAQLIQRAKRIAHLFPFGQQFVQDGGIGGAGRVQQHNSARMGAGQKLCKRLLGAGLAFLVPIHIGKAPENGSIAQLFRPGKVLVAELSLRRAVEFRHRLAGGLVIKRFGALQLLHELLFALCGHVGVVVGVVAHGVPFGRHAAHKGLLQGGDYKTQKDNLYQQFQLILEPIKDWKIFGELNYRTTTEFLHKDVNLVTKYDVNNNPWTNPAEQSSVLEQATKNNFFNPNVYTEYFKELNGGHAFKVMVGFQAELNKYRELGASRTDMITSNLPTLNTSTGTDKITKGGYSHWATAGFFGRINYNYKERYLLEVNARYDGTSRFSRDNRWNVFPSVSVGWNIAREAFWEPYTDVVNNLKLRGSWGELGNQNTTNLYPYYQLLKFAANDANSHWLLNGMKPNTANAPDLISTLLSWETMRSWNIGIDVGALQNRLTFSFDYFNRKTLDMVGPAPELPVILGATVPKTNNADMESKGFELDIAWRDRIGKVDYGAHILLSDDRQRVTRYSNPTGTLNTWYEGQYSGEIWGYVTHGIAKTDEEMQDWLANHKQSFGNSWAAGDIMYEDLNGDGEVNEGSNTITDSGDKKIIGNSSPRYKFGIDLDASWNGFDIRMFFQGVAKRDYWLGDNMFWGASGGLWQSTCFTDHLDFFRSEGDDWGANLNAYFPRPILDGGKNQKKQTRYLQNAAYLRLKNLQIGYTLPASLTNKAGLSKLRVFLSVENLFTISGLPDSFDPETLGSGYGNWNGAVTESAKSYPLSRTVSTGLSVTF